MKIFNVHGSSKVSEKPGYPYDSWLDQWETNISFTLRKGQRYICPGCGKSFYRSSFDGCHVQKYNSTDKKWYIVPLCDSCNHTDKILDIGNTTLVPVPSNNDK